MKSQPRDAAPEKLSGPASSAPASSVQVLSEVAPPAAPAAPINKVRLALLVSMLFSLLVSGIFRTPPIVFMAAVLCSAPLAAIALGKFSSRRLHIKRTLAQVGTAGETLHGTLTIENNSRWPALITQLRAGQVIRPLYGKAERGDWPVLAEADGLHEIPVLGAYERLEVPQSWHLRRRGVYLMPPARAGSIDPLGFATDLSAQSTAQEIIVLPRTIRLERLGFVGGSAARMQAPQHSSMVADAMDFHGVRPWQPGEAIRRIHWKSTARTGQLQIVEWEENVARDLALVLDTQASSLAGSGGENTLETTVSVAASVAQHLLEGGYACQIFCWQPRENGLELVHLDARSAGDLAATMRLLAGIRPTDAPSATLPELAKRTLENVQGGRATLLVSSTLADIDGARRLLGAHAATHTGTGTHAGASGTCYTLAIDAESFEKTAPSKKAAPRRSSALNSLDSLSRIIRCGDSIAAALEQMA